MIPFHGLDLPIRTFLGDVVADRLGAALRREQQPSAAARDFQTAEIAMLLAWALTGCEDAGAMPLLAVEGHTVEGQPGETFTASHLLAQMTYRTFGDALWAALKAGTNEQAWPAGRSENLIVARGSHSAAVTITMRTAPDTVFSLHFGQLAIGDRRIALEGYESNAVRGVGAAMLAHVPMHMPDFLHCDRQDEPRGLPH